MAEDIASNVKLMPIIIGIIASIVIVAIGKLLGNGVLGIGGIIIGSAISGFLTENTTLYAIIYGVIVGLISSFLIGFTIFSVPLCIILGIFGGFIGKVVQSNMQ